MKTKFILLAGILACGVSLQAATSYNFNFTQGSSGLTTDPADGAAISPYTGTIGGTSVKLYCDDFNDNITYNTSGLSAYVTALTATGTTLQDDTRYGVANAPNDTYPAGTTLYEEMAWLATQMQNTSGSSAKSNDIALQEAIWKLTNDSSGPDGASPDSSKNDTGRSTSGDSGTAQSAANWILDAETDYDTTVSGYTTLDTSDWYIVTETDAAGCTIGGKGTTGCVPGTAGTTTANTQEFLAYYTGGLPVTTQTSTAPEPASFFLIGSGLLAGAVFGRRRMKKTK